MSKPSSRGARLFSLRGHRQYDGADGRSYRPPVSGNATRIDAQLIAVMDMVVNQGCKEVVGNPNGMGVSGKE